MTTDTTNKPTAEAISGTARTAATIVGGIMAVGTVMWALFSDYANVKKVPEIEKRIDLIGTKIDTIQEKFNESTKANAERSTRNATAIEKLSRTMFPDVPAWDPRILKDPSKDRRPPPDSWDTKVKK